MFTSLRPLLLMLCIICSAPLASEMQAKKQKLSEENIPVYDENRKMESYYMDLLHKARVKMDMNYYSLAMPMLYEIAAAGYPEVDLMIADILIYPPSNSSVKEDRKKAIKYYRRAAERGYLPGMEKWARLNREGRTGTLKPNPEVAEFWTNLYNKRMAEIEARKKAEEEAKNPVFTIPEEDIIPESADGEIPPVFRSKMTPLMKQKLDLAKDLWKRNRLGDARLVYQTLADAGVAEAQCELGDILFYGYGNIPRDADLALSYLLRSARQGYAPAQYNLAHIYSFYNSQFGDDAPDLQERYRDGIFWLRHLVGSEDPDAQEYQAKVNDLLGFMYYFGRGVPVDKKEAKRYYEGAAALGNKSAKESLKKYTF